MIHRVKPHSVHKADHAVTYLISSADHRFLLANSNSRKITVFLLDHHRNYTLPRTLDPLAAAINNGGFGLAYVDQDSGHLMFYELDRHLENRVSSETGHTDCHFDEANRLWSVRATEDHFILEIHRGSDSERITSPPFSDDYYTNGGAMIISGGSRSQVVVNVYSGQSESENYLAELIDDEIQIRHLSEMDGEQIPRVAPHGDEIITLDRDDPQVHRFTRPFDSIQQSIPWPHYDEEEAEDERPGYDCCYLDDVNALIASAEGRVFTLHTRSMQITAEIRIEGFAPEIDTPEELPYGSDLVTFARLNDQVCFLFGQGRQQRLVMVPIENLMAS